MAQRFFGKKLHKKYVRPIRNSEVSHKVKNNINEIKQEESDMNKLEKVEEILDIKVPKKRVKVEKKEKGLYEREEKVTLITEDNKLILND